MADLYGTSPSPASEPEEISNFLHQLLHNSTSCSSSKFLPPAPAPVTASSAADAFLDRRRFGRSEPATEVGNSGKSFSDASGFFGKETGGNGAAAAASVASKRRGAAAENNDLVGDFSCDSEGVEAPLSETARPRSSSKRSRAAEVHNLSEKRRRSRINEKMKALQNLIPNSNKTDKASMLDEAIEYLKQLQLQVQMLTLRNGLSLQPMCLPGVLQPMQLPLTGMTFEEGNGLLNTNTVTGAYSANEESSVQASLSLPNQCNISNQSIVVPSGRNISPSETSFGFEPVMLGQYGPYNLSTPPKEICRENKSEAQLDPTQIMKTSSSGVS